MKVFGLMMVRNEADILRVNLLHHFSVGIDRFLIVDNGSTDGTDRILRDFTSDGYLEWRRDDGPYRQAEITTELAREAFRQGADWVIPIDADEFWYAPDGDLRAVLEKSTSGAIQIEVLNFIQQRDQIDATPEGLLLMTRRVPLPVGPLERVKHLVETRQNSYVEMMYSPKFISRPSEAIEIAMGNHGVTGVRGAVEVSGEIVCLHAVLRSKSVLESKVEQGERVAELGLAPEQGWHVRRWTRLAEEGGLDDEWRANSYAGDCLDVYGAPHAVVYDPKLRDLVAGWIERAGADTGIEGVDHATERAALLRTIRDSLTAYHREARRLTDTFRSEVGERDRIIRRQQEELHVKVGQCNRIIGELQEELQAKVAERDRTIVALQAELHEKVRDRDDLIRALQAEVGERLQVIRDTQAELHSKVGECNRIIGALQAELQAKVGERDQTILTLQAELHHNLSEYRGVIDRLQCELDRKIRERDMTIHELEGELDSIHSNKAWPFIRLLLGRRKAKVPSKRGSPA